MREMIHKDSTNSKGEREIIENRSKKPKPCPFCGNEQIIFLEGCVFFQCLVCGTLGPDGNDKITALELWNTRPEVE